LERGVMTNAPPERVRFLKGSVQLQYL
jgi:hypothetical protein